MKNKQKYYTYILRCEDNSLYTGMTNNIETRMNEHFSLNGAKYTKSHKAKKLEAVWTSTNRSLACRLEYHIKTLDKQKKEKIIKGESISSYFTGIVDCRRYRRIKESDIIFKG